MGKVGRKRKGKGERRGRAGRWGEEGGLGKPVEGEGSIKECVVSCVLLQDLVNKYYCQCVLGWEGQNCSVETNECINRPCLNGATCNVSYKSLQLWVCHCMRRLQPCKCNTANLHVTYFYRTCSMTTTVHVPVGFLGCTVRQKWMIVFLALVRTMPPALIKWMATPVCVQLNSR